MAGNVLMEKLLETVFTLNASDLHISVGQPPVIRVHSRLRRQAGSIWLLIRAPRDGDHSREEGAGLIMRRLVESGQWRLN